MAERRILNSWKEISQYVGRGVRTVQRYERTLSFPVRRVAGRARSSVMAFSDEIDIWLNQSSLGLPSLQHQDRNISSDSSSDLYPHPSIGKILLRADAHKIWLIEDDSSHVQAFRAALAKLGQYQVIVFDTASAALQAITDVESGKSRPPALIVLDYELAGSSGFEVLTHYRSTAELRSVVPLIVWSVLDSVTIREMSMWMGAKSFVAKQVGERVLSRTLESALSQTHSRMVQTPSKQVM
jgi:PleD family two-component response regulator